MELSNVGLLNLWGMAGVAFVLTCLYCGMCVWAKKQEWDEDGGVTAVIIILCFGFFLIGFWATWIYQIVNKFIV